MAGLVGGGGRALAWKWYGRTVYFTPYLSITFGFCSSLFNVPWKTSLSVLKIRTVKSAKEKRRYISMASLRQPEVIRGRNVAIDYGALDAVIRSFQRAIYLLTRRRWITVLYERISSIHYYSSLRPFKCAIRRMSLLTGTPNNFSSDILMQFFRGCDKYKDV